MSGRLRVVVTGGNGFIGSHLAHRLHQRGLFVRVVDITDTARDRIQKDTMQFCSEFVKGDLRDEQFCRHVFRDGIDWCFHLAANMGGMGTIGQENDFIIYRDNSTMTLNVFEAAFAAGVKHLFYASSACVYPASSQVPGSDTNGLVESVIWTTTPAPQHFYGAEKLIGEILAMQYGMKGMDIRIARFHNVYGEGSAWYGGKEKAPAALIRKAIVEKHYSAGAPSTMEIWGDGSQRRSFLYIDDCIDGCIALMGSDCKNAINIGSDEDVSIDELAYLAFETVNIPRSQVELKHDLSGPSGVHTRNSNNDLAKRTLSWSPSTPLRRGLLRLSGWIQVELQAMLAPDLRSADGRQRLCEAMRSSLIRDMRDRNQAITFAVLVPLSLHVNETNAPAIMDHIERFAANLATTTLSDRAQSFFAPRRFNLAVILGVNAVSLTVSGLDVDALEGAFRRAGIYRVTTLVQERTEMWQRTDHALVRELSKLSFERDNPDYVMVIASNDAGELPIIRADSWMTRIDREFLLLAEEKDGVGCVALMSDHARATLPIVTRAHLAMFQGELLPLTMPFSEESLLHLYRVFGSLVVLADVCVSIPPRALSAVRACTGKEMARAVSVIQRAATRSPAPMLTIDLILVAPDMALIEALLDLSVSGSVSVMVIAVYTGEMPPSVELYCRDVVSERRLQVHSLPKETTEAMARKAALEQSCSDWVMFLNRDAVPARDMLVECEQAITRVGEQNERALVGVVCPAPMITGSTPLLTSAFSISGIPLGHAPPGWAPLLARRRATISPVTVSTATDVELGIRVHPYFDDDMMQLARRIRQCAILDMSRDGGINRRQGPMMTLLALIAITVSCAARINLSVSEILCLNVLLLIIKGMAHVLPRAIGRSASYKNASIDAIVTAVMLISIFDLMRIYVLIGGPISASWSIVQHARTRPPTTRGKSRYNGSSRMLRPPLPRIDEERPAEPGG